MQGSAEGTVTVEAENITNQAIFRFRVFGSHVVHGPSLPPHRTLPRRVRTTLAILYSFTLSRQLASSLSACGFCYHWEGLYFDRCGTLWLPALAPMLA